ncbi:MAG TPA: hypothetical protein VFW65_05705 [Pseudonocardiaceae bacterium]|nr:hypothetical protein [Pseudonocardiaceae bacterium]
MTVTSGDTASFTETVTAAADAAPGDHHCTVDYLVDGTSRGFVEDTTVHARALAVDDVTVTAGTGGRAPSRCRCWAARPRHRSPCTTRAPDGTATAPAD